MAEEIHQAITTIREEANGENALKILYISAYLTPAKGLHLDMFLSVCNDNEKELFAATQRLKQKSLMHTIDDVYSNKSGFLITELVQNEIRTFLKKNGNEKDVLAVAIDLLTIHLSKEEIHPNYIDHALSVVTYVLESGELLESSVRLPSLILTALKRQNRLGEAYVFGENALKFLAKALGDTHEEILTLRHNLPTMLDAEEEHSKAVKVLQELTEKDLKFSSVEEITKCLVQHAKRLSELSRYEDASTLYEILIGTKTVLETFDSEILTAWHDYAVLLSEVGHLSIAINILEDVFLQKRKVIVKGDEYGLVTRNRLASVLQKQGKYTEALEQFKEVWCESRKRYGELYPQTLRMKRDIGNLLLHKGEYEEALKILEDVEKKFKEILHESDLEILCTQGNIIDTLISLKEYSKALDLSKNVYEAYKHSFGEEHDKTLWVKYNIDKILIRQGNENEAG
ncbi:unnamed protein product [Larinioides sclopetarius]|uniref:MalT-like TPR region domain-containing protein n=1 Tax=Larinioides sclopetarius TaxID=280406 RepID=A0AAV1ZDZ0_9ARAC